MEVTDRVHAVLRRVPGGVNAVAATKGRTPDEIREALQAGITHLGENYVQEGERKKPLLPGHVT